VLNHDFATDSSEDVLKELKGEPAQPVTVGNHNLLDIAPQRSVQKGEQAGTFPVDARSNVAYDFMLRERFLQGPDLSLEIVLLWCTRDSCIADSSFGHFLSVLWEAFEYGLDVGPLAAPTKADNANFTGNPPVVEGGGRDPQGRLDDGCRNKLVGFILL
jgi:hypothetical protein